MTDPRGRFEIHVHTRGLRITGEDPVELSLGGSETAVVSMARALARRGHRVSVSCNTAERHRRGGVVYLPEDQVHADRAGWDCDLFLAARFFEVLHRPPPARMVGLWHHDMPHASNLELLRVGLARASFSFFLSGFHQAAYTGRLPELGRHAVRTTNGVDFDAVEAVRATAAARHRPPRFLFASRPERGLEVLLLDIWPRIRERLPGAELLVTTYAYEGLELPGHVRAFHEHCADLVRRGPGVRQAGSLTRRELWREMAASTAVLYPTDFPEISCMVALEAQALGVPIVTTDRFALRETVGFSATRVAEPWLSPAYADSFVDLAVRLAEDAAFHREASAAGRRHVRRETHSWDALAGAWEELLSERFRHRFETHKAGVLRRLLHLSDVAAARRLAAGCAPRDFDPADLEALRRRTEGGVEEVEAEPVWKDFEPGALPPQMAQTCRILASLLGPKTDATVLEVGCDAGNLALLLLRDHPGLELVGVDGNRRAVELARAKAQELGLAARARFLHVADPHLPVDPPPAELGEAAFDAVLLCEVLELFDDPAALLAWAEGRARHGVVGYVLYGPWASVTGEGSQLHHLDRASLDELLGGRADLELRYVRCGATPRGEELGCWFFSYRVNGGETAGALDLDRKIRRTPPLPRISATLLVKNEEAHIRRCVEGLEAIADEIVVGETGPRDQTLAILESMGFVREPGPASSRRLVSIDFEDFAQARNALLAHARGDYILWLDADEILVGASILRRLVDGNEFYDGFGVEQRHLTLDSPIDSDYPLRCFRPRLDAGSLRWYGCIHEHIELRLNEPPPKVYLVPGIYLAHLGYLFNELRAHKAFTRNFPLLLKDREENPDRWMGRLLGIREYLQLARWELSYAHQMTEKAYRCLNHGYELWQRHGEEMPGRYRDLAFRISRDILALLAEHQLPLRRTGRVPVRIDFELGLLTAPGPAPAEREREWTWYADPDEVRRLVSRRLEEVEAEIEQAGRRRAPRFNVRQAPEMSAWSLPPESFGLDPFADDPAERGDGEG